MGDSIGNKRSSLSASHGVFFYPHVCHSCVGIPFWSRDGCLFFSRRKALRSSAFHTAHLSVSRVWLCRRAYSQPLSTPTDRFASPGQPVHMVLMVRKFFCAEPGCVRKIFVERLAPVVAPWARVTARLFQLVQLLGLATGGRPEVRVTDRLGIQTSRHSMLRRIMALPAEPVGQITELGSDDFSDHAWTHVWNSSHRSAPPSGPRCSPRQHSRTRSRLDAISPSNPGCEPGPWRGLCCCGTDIGSPGDGVALTGSI